MMAINDLTNNKQDLQGRLLGWYALNGREFSWRAISGAIPDPYSVWVSEIMLQQTRADVATPFIQKFLIRWPKVSDLANASLEEVLSAWAGLGYYARGRNLHRCALIILNEYDGVFPESEEELKKLPGIGNYTAAAIAAIAFDHPTVGIDVNVERVISRLFGVKIPFPKARPSIKKIAESIHPYTCSRDWTQALMDLGALVCKSKDPECNVCPWNNDCVAEKLKLTHQIPIRSETPIRSKRYGIIFLLTRPDGSVLFERRPEKGLLPGMLGLPGTPWRSYMWGEGEIEDYFPGNIIWEKVNGVVKHTFSHFHLELSILSGRENETDDKNSGIWISKNEIMNAGLPSVMKKVILKGLS